MKKFTKGTLETVVDDNDPRIASYTANGWKESELTPKAKDAADKLTDKALGDVKASESEEVATGKGKSGKGKTTAADKKVNAAIKANATAASESEEVDDGLLPKGGISK